jgi:hypothetical protein
MVRNTVIIQHDAARLHTLLDHVNKVIDGQCGGNPANFTGVIVFVCSPSGIDSKKRGREFGPGGTWDTNCRALQKLIQALPKGAFVFQGSGSAELWNFPGFDVNAEQVLNFVDNDQTGGLIIRAEKIMRSMALVSQDYHFDESFTEMVSSSISLSTIFLRALGRLPKG